MSAGIVPLHLDLSRQALGLLWDDGRTVLDAATLRAQCRCNLCRQGPVLPASGLGLCGVEPVGNYGVQLRFSDGHDKGIYPWALLRALGQKAVALE